jgi:hypothetical protein
MSLTPINSLMYADDVAIIGQPSDVQQLLLLAETHSTIFGYRWNPLKCEVLNSPPDTHFSLYDTIIPTCETFKYLGIPFSSTGIDQPKLISHSRNKALHAMRGLKSSGAHRYGFGITAALRAYKIFVRPILEYSLAILHLTLTSTEQSPTKLLEQTQFQCLRMCMNLHESSNIGVRPLAVLAGLPSMINRARILQVKFIYRSTLLPNDTLLFCIIQHIFRNNRNLISDSPPRRWQQIMNNPIWHNLLTKIKPFNNPNINLDNILQAPSDSPAWTPSYNKLQEFIQQHLFFSKQILRNQIKTIGRGHPAVAWDPILLLPSTNKERSRMLRWRLAWLPPGPSVQCLCGEAKANLQHFDICTNTHYIITELHSIYSTHKQQQCPYTDLSIGTCKDLIDSVLNDLPSKFNEDTDPIWIHLWPCLLRLLLAIDSSTSSSRFPREPSAGQIGVDRLEKIYKKKQKQQEEQRALSEPPLNDVPVSSPQNP